MATSRSADQVLASSASYCWLMKLSKGVAVAAAASSGVPCAVMLLSLSMVNVILDLLFSALFAVITWITPNCLKGKAILLEIDNGEGLAMPTNNDARQYSDDNGAVIENRFAVLWLCQHRLRQRGHCRLDSIYSLGGFQTFRLCRLAIVFFIVLQLQTTRHPVQDRIVSVLQLPLHICTQQELGRITEMQEALLYLDHLHAVFGQLHGFGPEIVTIIRHPPQVEDATRPLDTLLYGAQIDGISGGGFDETAPDPVRERHPTHPFQMNHPFLGHPEER